MKILLGTIAHLTANPFNENQEHSALQLHERGALAINAEGRIAACGNASDILPKFKDATIHDYGKAWLLPGFVDGHIHFPQFYCTAAFGEQLLDWLEKSVFPAEEKFVDPTYAKAVAKAFVQRLLSTGTTTAMVFGSQFQSATESLFDEAHHAGLRILTGLTLMDRGGAPKSLFINPNEAYDRSVKLIHRFHGQGNLHYAITPRFAITSSPALLEMCGQLSRDFPDCHIQTHINENKGEIEEVTRLFPQHKSYLDVYDQAGLITKRTMLAHNIHTSETDLNRMAEAACAVCHCPTSNLYLGSGLFRLKRHLEAGVEVCIGTDVGAGPHFFMPRELSHVYQVQQIQGVTLNDAKLLYLGTLAGARALGLDQETGNLEAGKSADVVVIDPGKTAYLDERLNHEEDPRKQLFALLLLSETRNVAQTYVAGTPRLSTEA